MAEPEVTIGRDTIIALAAMAWADGKIAPSEAEGMRQAARQLGLSSEDTHAVEDALARRVEVAEVETLRMNRLTRLFTFAVASWMGLLDGGSLKPEEEAALSALGDRLGLSSVARERARTVTRTLSGDGTAELDLLKLRSRLSASLSQVGDD